MTKQETINKAAQSLIDAGCDVVSIITTWHDGESSKCLMIVPTKGGDHMAPKKSPAGKKKPMGSKKPPMKPMC